MNKFFRKGSQNSTSKRSTVAVSPNSAMAGMDYHQDRSKQYASQNYSGTNSAKSEYQERESRSSGRAQRSSHHSNEISGDSRRNRSKSSKSPYSTTSRRSSSGNSSQFPPNMQTPNGSTAVPNGDTQHSQAGHYNNNSSSAITPSLPPDLQSNYPPNVSSSQSQSSSSQRRPAYLLHRDLVIGKGSYGQVCIASRGEPEGHSSGGTGKRKKFACKCVVLRNDAKYIAKLQEEVNVLRELRGHENVIRLYDVFCVDNELFIITELGRGGDLFHLLTTHPKHGVTEAYAGNLAVISIFYTIFIMI